MLSFPLLQRSVRYWCEAEFGWLQSTTKIRVISRSAAASCRSYTPPPPRLKLPARASVCFDFVADTASTGQKEDGIFRTRLEMMLLPMPTSGFLGSAVSWCVCFGSSRGRIDIMFACNFVSPAESGGQHPDLARISSMGRRMFLRGAKGAKERGCEEGMGTDKLTHLSPKVWRWSVEHLCHVFRCSPSQGGRTAGGVARGWQRGEGGCGDAVGFTVSLCIDLVSTASGPPFTVRDSLTLTHSHMHTHICTHPHPPTHSPHPHTHTHTHWYPKMRLT
jgi:hypothetical protein